MHALNTQRASRLSLNTVRNERKTHARLPDSEAPRIFCILKIAGSRHAQETAKRTLDAGLLALDYNGSTMGCVYA